MKKGKCLQVKPSDGSPEDEESDDKSLKEPGDSPKANRPSEADIDSLDIGTSSKNEADGDSKESDQKTTVQATQKSKEKKKKKKQEGDKKV